MEYGANIASLTPSTLPCNSLDQSFRHSFGLIMEATSRAIRTCVTKSNLLSIPHAISEDASADYLKIASLRVLAESRLVPALTKLLRTQPYTELKAKARQKFRLLQIARLELNFLNIVKEPVKSVIG